VLRCVLVTTCAAVFVQLFSQQDNPQALRLNHRVFQLESPLDNQQQSRLENPLVNPQVLLLNSRRANPLANLLPHRQASQPKSLPVNQQATRQLPAPLSLVLESRSGTKESSALGRQSSLIISMTRDEVSRPLPYSSLTLSFRKDDSHLLHRQLLSSLLRLRSSVVIGFHSHQMASRVSSVGDRILGVQPHDPQHSWRSLRVVARESLE
jgi:hypothetical protein